MPVLYLTEEVVEQLLDMRTAVSVMETLFQQLAESRAVNVPRVRARTEGLVLHSMIAAADYLGLVGCKNYTTSRRSARFHLSLYDANSGELVALIEAGRLGQLRTGATTGVAVQWLAEPNATELGLFGSGYQAETQLEAVAQVRQLSRVFVYSRQEAKRAAFAATMSERLKLDVIAVDRPQEAAEELPIVITATTSPEPVFHGADLAEGALVCAVGSNWPQRAEIDADVIRRADNISCDSVEACQKEAGDFRDAIERGIFSWTKAVELADVVVGKSVGRNNKQSVVLFKSVGLAIEDVALGATLLERARAAGVGRELDI
ncbi:MAG: ornithine cyclodeaminase family protein [Planctomycetota bacterium]|nr:ornithine cyclodeaminase family protein [Planctomycetota bacterium]